MRLHSRWTLKSDKQSTIVFEVIERLEDGVILKKGNFSRPVHYGKDAFEQSFDPIKAQLGD